MQSYYVILYIDEYDLFLKYESKSTTKSRSVKPKTIAAKKPAVMKQTSRGQGKV